MKKAAAILLTTMICLFMFIISGCEEKEIVCQKPVEFRYRAAYTGVEKNFYIVGDYFVPVEEKVYYPDKYEVNNITYEDGSTMSEWRTVDKETYEKARDKLPP